MCCSEKVRAQQPAVCLIWGQYVEHECLLLKDACFVIAETLKLNELTFHSLKC